MRKQKDYKNVKLVRTDGRTKKEKKKEEKEREKRKPIAMKDVKSGRKRNSEEREESRR